MKGIFRRISWTNEPGHSRRHSQVGSIDNFSGLYLARQHNMDIEKHLLITSYNTPPEVLLDLTGIDLLRRTKDKGFASMSHP